MQIKDLSPKEVFNYFSEISAIPRSSGNTARIADYCMDFARRNNLSARKDDMNNVIIFKEGSKGYEQKAPVILQGHLDMVCEKEPDCDIDMDVKGVSLCSDGKNIWADGTTLGADDGIAVAYILAILASDTIAHPPIQAVLTSDEEIGMLGARELDTKDLTAKMLINIDSESEGVLYVSCAGGVRAQCEIPVEYTENSQSGDDLCDDDTETYEISVSGLIGGHSGAEIHKQNTNAIRLLASVLANLHKEYDFRLVDITGGGKENAIPKEAKAVIRVADNNNNKHLLYENISAYENIIKKDIIATEPDVRIDIHSVNTKYDNCLTAESTKNVIFALQMTPDGVYKMSPEIKGMVQTSLNLGTAYINDNKLVYRYLIRSNVSTGKELLLERVTAFVNYLNGEVITMSDYPAWEYNKNSRLKDICVKCFNNIYGYEPQVTSIHAGLECGILSGKMPGTDMISFGPKLMDVHTPKERMDIGSAQRTWEYLLEILKNM
ncbi:MAG: aminoacyl-histidine dipeptidase [Lachnospira sp.]|nr:aminoacyl-histidine dipeptidase [Lachnospira sp.]